MVIVPRDAPGVEILRPLGVFGHEHDHAEIIFNDVRVRVSGGLTRRAFLSSSSSRARLEYYSSHCSSPAVLASVEWKLHSPIVSCTSYQPEGHLFPKLIPVCTSFQTTSTSSQIDNCMDLFLNCMDLFPNRMHHFPNRAGNHLLAPWLSVPKPGHRDDQPRLAFNFVCRVHPLLSWPFGVRCTSV